MIENVFDRIGLAETHRDLFRNIVSLRHSENLFDDLSDDPDDWDSAIELEATTKPPLFSSRVPVIDRPFEEAAWNEAIGYPFSHWMRSRFSDGSFGVWYGGETLETTVHETVHHWRTRLLADAGFTQPGIRIDRKIYNVRCDAALVDLRPLVADVRALVDPADYTLTQQIGGRFHREGHPGLVSISARYQGSVFAILNPRVLSNPRHALFLTYTTVTDGVAVEREPGSVWLTI